nr:MAG TPA: hypothetical protein [Caudoviricetes sp.]
MADYPVSSLGDGLFSQGGDVFCACSLISSERIEEGAEGKVVNEYEKYTVTVSYDIEGSKRSNPRWERVYKEE